jgi:hypothetical protein
MLLHFEFVICMYLKKYHLYFFYFFLSIITLKFGWEYKWCDKLCIMHDILDCIPQIMFAQKEIFLMLMLISTDYMPSSPYHIIWS